MPKYSSSPGKLPAESDETARNQLLRFLRLVAKDVVRRIVVEKFDTQNPSGGPEPSRQRPSEH